MARPSSASPPPPPLLLFSFPRIHLTCLSLNLPLLPAVIMMIGSGPAAICSPPSFLTNHYLHFHYSYCRAHMQWLYKVFFFPFYLTWAWKYMLFWLAKGHSLIFNTRALHLHTLKKKKWRRQSRYRSGCKFKLVRSWAERTSWIKECLSTAVKVFIFLFESQHGAPPSLWWRCANL